MMLRQFKQFVNQNGLFGRGERLLAAVSGGADSVVMLHLLAQCRLKVAVAHCNFQLRGADADGDEEFVRQLAAKYQMPFFSIRFNTLAYADEHRLSVEMAARELRYNWFAQLAAEHHFHRILTAHHLNDNIETMLLNLTRGTGINGLTGIAAINGNIARPLLFATRSQIEEYARLNNLTFRTDSTNLSDDYQRNIIRHRVVPVLKELNPAFEERMSKNFRHIRQAADIYNWFAQLATEHHYDRILTAHHLNDNIETLLLNLSRGTGINGLCGIAAANGNIVRPLLFATRTQIEEYARLNNLSFRTDSTNFSDDYQRNIIRHRVVPVMKQINPSFEDRMLKNFKHIRQAADIYNWYVGKVQANVLKTDGKSCTIDIKNLMQQPFAETVLFECLKPYGFNGSQVADIIKTVGLKSGNTFQSATHCLLVDRSLIVVEPAEQSEFEPIVICSPQNIDSLGLTMRVVPIADFVLDKRRNVACLDIDKLHFPLTIRRWQNGDFFYPIGMTKAQKLSDFFINNKVNVFDKKRIMVLTSGERIVWQIGYRPDNRFKIDNSTQRVLVVDMMNQPSDELLNR